MSNVSKEKEIDNKDCAESAHPMFLTPPCSRGEECGSEAIGALGVGRLSTKDTVFILLHGNAKVITSIFLVLQETKSSEQGCLPQDCGLQDLPEPGILHTHHGL